MTLPPQLQIISDASFDPIFAVDDDRRWLHVNAEAAELLGAPPQAVLGLRMDDFTPPEYRSQLLRSWVDFERDGTLEGQFVVLRADGSRRGIFFRAARDFATGVHLITARAVTGQPPSGRVLTPRELQVLQLAADGHSSAEVADELGVSPGTVKTHFQNMYAKLGARDRAAAVAQAMRRGFIR